VKKLFVCIGDGGSGKTTLIAELIRRHPDQFKRVVTCTSRPMRAGEVHGIDYHFLPEKYFIGNPDLVLATRTVEGWYYGTRKSELFSTSHHLLLTSKLTGVSLLTSLGCRNIIVVRMSISNQLKVERMRQRGDTEEIISHRLKEDDGDNGSSVDMGHIPIIDLQADQTIEEKIGHLLRHANT